MQATLTDEQLEFVREFVTSEAANLLFERLENGVISDWVNSNTTADREKHHQQLHALLLVKTTLRDTTAMKRLTTRATGARLYRSS